VNLKSLVENVFAGKRLSLRQGEVYEMEGGILTRLPPPIAEIRIVNRISYQELGRRADDVSFKFHLSNRTDPLWRAILAETYPEHCIGITGDVLEITCSQDRLVSVFAGVKKAFEQTNTLYKEAVPMIKELAEALDQNEIDQKARNDRNKAELRRTFEDLDI
jgi:hypothetical protein